MIFVPFDPFSSVLWLWTGPRLQVPRCRLIHLLNVYDPIHLCLTSAHDPTSYHNTFLLVFSLIGFLLMFHRFLPMYHSLVPSHGYCASHARTMSLSLFPYLLCFTCIDHSFLFKDFISHYYSKSGCIWLFVLLYFTQYINLVDTAIQLQTCSGRFPLLLFALHLAPVKVTWRHWAPRLLTRV